MKRKHIPMLIFLALATSLTSVYAFAVQLELTAAQVKAVCDSAGGCGPSTGPTGPTEPTQPITCPAGQRLNVTGTACEPIPSAGWNNQCAGFDATIVIQMDWANPQRMYTRPYGTMHFRDAVVVQFTTGSVATQYSLPRMTAAEYTSSPSAREATLSDKPCDWGPQSTPGATIAGNSVTAVFAIVGTGFGYYPVLKQSTTYYLNMKNAQNATCAQSDVCDMFVDLIKVGGL